MASKLILDFMKLTKFVIIIAFTALCVGLTACQKSELPATDATNEKLPAYIEPAKYARYTDGNLGRFQDLSNAGLLPQLSLDEMRVVAAAMARVALVNDAFDGGLIDQATLERERQKVDEIFRAILGMTVDEFAEVAFQ